MVGYKKEFDVNTQKKEDAILRLEIQSAVIRKHGLDESWVISTDEFNGLVAMANKAGIDIDTLVDKFSHIDSETGKVIAEGWVCFGGKYFFKDEASALKKVREHGFRSLNLASWANSKMGATYLKTPCK